MSRFLKFPPTKRGSVCDMSLLKILQFFVPGAQGHFRIFFAAVGVTFCLGTLGRCSCFGRAFFPRRRRSFYLRTHTKFYRSRFPCPWREKVTAPTSVSKTIKRFVGRSVDRWVGWADLPDTPTHTYAPTHPHTLCPVGGCPQALQIPGTWYLLLKNTS